MSQPVEIKPIFVSKAHFQRTLFVLISQIPKRQSESIDLYVATAINLKCHIFEYIFWLNYYSIDFILIWNIQKCTLSFWIKSLSVIISNVKRFFSSSNELTQFLISPSFCNSFQRKNVNILWTKNVNFRVSSKQQRLRRKQQINRDVCLLFDYTNKAWKIFLQGTKGWVILTLGIMWNFSKW